MSSREGSAIWRADVNLRVRVLSREGARGAEIRWAPDEARLHIGRHVFCFAAGPAPAAAAPAVAAPGRRAPDPSWAHLVVAVGVAAGLAAAALAVGGLLCGGAVGCLLGGLAIGLGLVAIGLRALCLYRDARSAGLPLGSPAPMSPQQSPRERFAVATVAAPA